MDQLPIGSVMVDVRARNELTVPRQCTIEDKQYFTISCYKLFVLCTLTLVIMTKMCRNDIITHNILEGTHSYPATVRHSSF